MAAHDGEPGDPPGVYSDATLQHATQPRHVREGGGGRERGREGEGGGGREREREEDKG